MSLFNVKLEEEKSLVDDKYTKKLNIPQYTPSAMKPLIQDLYNDSRTKELIAEINNANISQEEKDFLIKAAHRHTVFNYSKIADYYAHSNKEVQHLMERSALVIIDIDDAIANGYVKLSKNIRKIMDDSGVQAE